MRSPGPFPSSIKHSYHSPWKRYPQITNHFERVEMHELWREERKEGTKLDFHKYGAVKGRGGNGFLLCFFWKVLSSNNLDGSRFCPFCSLCLAKNRAWRVLAGWMSDCRFWIGLRSGSWNWQQCSFMVFIYMFLALRRGCPVNNGGLSACPRVLDINPIICGIDK